MTPQVTLPALTLADAQLQGSGGTATVSCLILGEGGLPILNPSGSQTWSITFPSGAWATVWDRMVVAYPTLTENALPKSRLRGLVCQALSGAGVRVAATAHPQVAGSLNATPSAERTIASGSKLVLGVVPSEYIAPDPVTLASGSTMAITVGTSASDLGKQRGATSGASDVGVLAMTVRKDDPTAAATPTNGQNDVAYTSKYGRLWVSNPLVIDSANDVTLFASQSVGNGTFTSASDMDLNGYACGDVVMDFNSAAHVGTGTPTMTINLIPIVNGITCSGSQLVITLTTVVSTSSARVVRLEGGRSWRMTVVGTDNSNYAYIRATGRRIR